LVGYLKNNGDHNMVKGDGRQEEKDPGCWNLSLTLIGLPTRNTVSPQAVQSTSSMGASPMPLQGLNV
jgi:hypothetical protein